MKQTQGIKRACLALGNATLPVFQLLLQYTSKKTLFDSHNHLPVPLGPGTVQAVTGVSLLLKTA
ncbi:MAG: hypothetical protein L6301_08205 [Desulfobacteraceae bacterium]|nr:hypothetical protein [Pseudomonadota bacterium]MCG2751813.1 hypothetical protein [Desulfobacteraceae bacterium]